MCAQRLSYLKLKYISFFSARCVSRYAGTDVSCVTNVESIDWQWCSSTSLSLLVIVAKSTVSLSTKSSLNYYCSDSRDFGL